MQETYLTVWRAAAAFAGAAVGGSAVGWVWTIAARRLVDAFRRRAQEAQQLPAALLRVAPAAEDEVLSSTVGDELIRALRGLTPEQRARILALRHAELTCAAGNRLEMLAG